MRKVIGAIAIVLLFCLVTTIWWNRPAKFFERTTGVRLPDGAKLIVQRGDSTERAYVWEFSSDIADFRLPTDLAFEVGYSEWNPPWFGYFGELKEGDFSSSMLFQIVRTSSESFAVGKDVKRRQIAFSWMDTN